MEIDDIRELFPLFVSHSSAAVAIKSLDGRYLFANQAFARYAGAEPEHLVDASDHHILGAERARRSGELDAAAIAQRSRGSTEESVVRDGTVLTYMTTRFPILGAHGRPVALGLIALEVAQPGKQIELAENALREAQAVNSQLRMAIGALEELASTDRLTSAWNRRRFEETLEGETHRSSRYGHPLSMLLIDIDHFKRINDSHGHREGDRVLVDISTLIRAVLRKSDSLTRWGGEEFIVLMPNTGLGRAQATARRICETIAAHPFAGIGNVTVSIGVAEYLPEEAADAWLERADRAMYAAKQGGRNRSLADPSRSLTRNDVEHLERSFVQLVWKPSFNSGHPLIDDQHRILFGHANQLLDCVMSGRPRDEVIHSIEQLVHEASRHFEQEEQILEQLGFDGLEAHRGEHASLLRRCHALVRELEAGRVALAEVFQFLAHDLVAIHLLGADRNYFALTLPQDAAGEPRPA